MWTFFGKGVAILAKRCLTWWFKLGFRVGVNFGFRFGTGISCDGWVLGKKLSSYCPRKESLCVHVCVHVCVILCRLHSEYMYTL